MEKNVFIMMITSESTSYLRSMNADEAKDLGNTHNKER